MASGIKEIRERVVQIVEAATPDVDPFITYRDIGGRKPIEQYPVTGRASQTTRQFQVTSQAISEEGFLGGCEVEQQQRIRITLRYYVSDKPDGLLEVTDRAASDSARIEERLLLPAYSDNWVGTPLININFAGAADLYQGTLQDVWYMGLDYVVTYRLDQDTLGGEFAGNYSTLQALKAALVGRKTGTTARLINARTRELIGVWVVGSTRVRVVDFTKADGTEFLDGTDIISQGAGTWSITYGTGLVVATDAAEFFGYGDRANSDILGTGTHTSYTREEIDSYTSQGDIDAVTGTTDQVVALVGADGSLTNHQRWDNVSAWDVISVPAALCYTTVASLLAAAGTPGARAALCERAGATPLVWYRFVAELSVWWPEEFVFESLNSAEQAMWDSFVAAGSGSYVWTSAGVKQSGVASRVTFEGLHPAGISLTSILSALIDMQIEADVEAATTPDKYDVSVRLGWGSSRNNEIGAGFRSNIASTDRTRGLIDYLNGGARTSFSVGVITDVAPSAKFRVSLGWGILSNARPQGLAGGLKNVDTNAVSVAWGTIPAPVIPELVEDIYGVILDWIPTGTTGSSVVRRVTFGLGVS